MYNIFQLLLVFIVFLGLFHYFLVFKKNLSKKQWKQVDYIWFCMSFIGLISLASDVRISQVSQDKLIQESHMETFWNVADRLSKDAESTYECNVFKMFDNDSDKKDYALNKDRFSSACEWRKETELFFSDLNQESYPEVKIDDLPIPKLDSSELLGDYEWLQREIPIYNLHRESWLEIKSNSFKNTFEQILYLLSPFFIAIALALRLTKVTGEVRHEN
ncbi:hypothetical protein [Pseudoalteromonas sp. T1lg24]|uniref:hypothetical protein n=1 Tax=Pseudoalteromonas sp. T1lg24 TaxID=2077099 RepID=UPI000CF6B53A|nr:hypothetical protein [Pseudoalteromonas sp. T1lg24]